MAQAVSIRQLFASFVGGVVLSSFAACRVPPETQDALVRPFDARQALVSSVTAVETGGFHTCALWTPVGAVYCWGRNTEGEWGDGTKFGPDHPLVTHDPPAPEGAYASLRDVVQVAVGGFHTCARTRNGAVYCWGDPNAVGRSPTAKPYLLPDPTLPARILSESDAAVDVSAGDAYTCAVLKDGTVRCWGYGYYGRLGNGAATSAAVLVPVPVTGLSDAVAVATAEGHTCALRIGGAISCWGSNSVGQLGPGASTMEHTTPIEVPGIQARAIVVGEYHTCALLSDRSVSCWGGNSIGQLGTGESDQDAHATPTKVPGLANVIRLTRGYNHGCAVLEGGKVKCWGENRYAQCGNSTGPLVAPTQVLDLGPATYISGGYGHSCALVAGDPTTPHCWGFNNAGQLTDGTNTNSAKPVP